MRIYLDSNIFIYAFECETDLGHAARRAFELIDSGQILPQRLSNALFA